ncbi:methyl-accepting chemotaxis protein [Pokkaliibacter plantistimulans]|uniref:Methyl-accepting chemotaxis protein n=1 Tax=Proteobacteria bacterium 228 TaxID=2083153 RepID=A0A2S5KIB5_9PROT|nr:methyl-accepting chemotaxis protein [Pokkaliibacter plantistimulans]PPC74561.1 methyl-accepting chemotaxis protein [Pokkaliibacter plantistimulans]
MPLSILQRVIGGFTLLVLLLLTIVATSYKGIHGVSSKLDMVTGETLPLNQTASDMNATLLRANQDLLGLLINRNSDEVNAGKSSFDGNIQTLQTQLGQIPTLLDASTDSSLTDLLAQISSSTEGYVQLASQLTELHLQKLSVDQQIKAQQEDVMTKGDQLVEFLNKFIADNPTGNAQNQAAGLLREVSKVVSGYKAFQINQDVKRLTRAVKYQDRTIKQRLDQLATVDSDKAKSAAIMANPIITSAGDANGLFQLFVKQVDLASQIDSQTTAASTAIKATLDTIGQFSSATLATLDQAKQQAHQTITTSESILLGIALFAIAVALLIGLWVAFSIKRPLARFRDALIKMTKGDLRVQFNSTSKDEFAELGRYLNELNQTLSRTLSELANSADTLAQSSESNAQISNTTTQAVNEQKVQLTSTASAMTEMEASVQEVAHRAQDTLEAVTSSDRLRQEMRSSIEETVSNIRGQAEQIQHAYEVTSRLDGYSQKIDSIIDAIRNIAEQTNLLALNAAIEAARAGEQGRGFAVVADEVRSLATRTQSSTGEIQQMIEQMQAMTKEVVTVMQTSQSKTEQCVGAAGHAEQALEDMDQAIQVIREMNIQIASATEQQSSTAQEISRSINHINDYTEHTASGAEQTASSGQVLMQMARQQKQLLGYFHF